jgi:hypothetical protein
LVACKGILAKVASMQAAFERSIWHGDGRVRVGKQKAADADAADEATGDGNPGGQGGIAGNGPLAASFLWLGVMGHRASPALKLSQIVTNPGLSNTSHCGYQFAPCPIPTISAQKPA